MSKYKNILEQDRKKRETLALTNLFKSLNRMKILDKSSYRILIPKGKYGIFELHCKSLIHLCAKIINQ